MAKRIFDLSGVHDAEADELRSLLTDSGIPFYETPRGDFGISMAALWVSNDSDAARAREIIEKDLAHYSEKPVMRAGLNNSWKIFAMGHPPCSVVILDDVNGACQMMRTLRNQPGPTR